MKRWSIGSHHFVVILLTLTFSLLTPVYGNLGITPVEDYLCSGGEGGPFAPAQKVYTLTNQGAAAITWGVSESMDWIDCSPPWGTVGAGETVDVTVSLTPAAETLTEGEYSETLTFTDITNGVDIMRQVVLTVEVVSTGPVAWWKMDGDATDSSGNGYDGTAYDSPAWIGGGVHGGAVQLDPNDYIEIDNSNSMLSGSHAVTICLWMKTDVMNTGGNVFTKGTTGSPSAFTCAVHNISQNRLRIRYKLGGIDYQTGVYTDVEYWDNQWHHLAYVIKSGEQKIYYDGIEVGSSSNVGVFDLSDNTDPIRIGAAYFEPTDDYTKYYNGLIDDVQLYNRSLSRAEILEVAGIGPLVVQPSSSFDASGEPGGPFTPGYKDYTLKNVGDESLYWGIDALPSWLDVDSSFGSLGPNETAVVRVFLTVEAELLGEGLHTTAVTFNNLSQTQDSIVREVNLDIQTIRGVWTNPESFNLTVTEGTEQADMLTIGTDGTETVNFTLRSRTVSGAASATNRAMALNNALRVAPPQKIMFDPQQAVAYEHTPDQLLVRFAPSDQQNLVREVQQQKLLSASTGIEVVKQYRTVPGLSLVQLSIGVTMEEAIASLNAREDVLYAQPDYRVHAYSVFPNDARFDDLWGLHNTGQTGGLAGADVDMPQAWEIATGSDSVVVAVIDTGIDYNHEDLAGNMWVNQAEYNGTSGVDDDGNGYVDDIYGYDFDHGDGDPMDDHYHGTHCAGTIGAVGNNGIGVAGVCWDVKLMAVKFLDSGGRGSTSDAIASVEYATLMGVDVMSNSWGGGSFSQGLKDAIDAAGAAGIVFVAAAGNDSADNDRYPHYPSSYTSDNIIAVMSTTDEDQRSSFSCWGLTSVDIGAPGSSILSCEPGNRYQYLNGTSMACPHVAGACALLRSVSPALGVSEIKNVLFNTADTIPALADRCVTEGRLNVNSAMLETAVPWIEFDFEQGAVGPEQSVEVAVTFNAAELAPGQYHAEILVLSDDPARPQLTIPVSLTVMPDPLEVTPETAFDPNGLEGGPFDPDSMIYTLTNIGTESLDWSVDWQADWLNIEPASGTLGVGETVEVLVSLNTDVLTLAPELYEDEILFNNLTVGSVRKREVILTVRPPDKFTQMFDGDVELLQNASITFRPDGTVSYYAACIAKESVGAFEIGSQEGTFVPIGDDDYAEISFADGKQFDFYGIVYDRVYIGSNGYLTFGQGDVEFEAMLEYHFDMPRISAFFTDLTPSDNQSISYIQTDDRFVVTYQDIPVFGDKAAANTFQVELFFADGAIRMSYLNLNASGVIAGLSDGRGLPGFFEESNLLSYLNCCDCGDTNGDSVVDLSDLCDFALVWLQADCTGPDWCQRADFDRSGQVDLLDWRMMSENWKKVDYTWSEPRFLLELNGKAWGDPEYLLELDGSLDNHAKGPCLSRDGMSLYFYRYEPSLGMHAIVEATRAVPYGPFTSEKVLSELNTVTITDVGCRTAWISSDDLRLYYREQISETENRIKMAQRSAVDQPWTPNVRVFDELHENGYRGTNMSLTEDELTIVWHSGDRPGTGAIDLWMASRGSIEEPFTNIRELTEIDTVNNDSGPYISPDGLTLYFGSSNRVGGDLNTSGIYKATRSSRAELFGNVELVAFPGYETMSEGSPYYDFERNMLYFQDTNSGGIWMTALEPDPVDYPSWNMCLSSDQLNAYYTRVIPEDGRSSIVEASRANMDEAFADERVYSQLSMGQNGVFSVWISDDKLRLYFHEDGLAKMSQRTNPSEPFVSIMDTFPEIRGDGNTASLTLTADELTIVFQSNQSGSDAGGPVNLWIASRSSLEEPFSNKRPLDEINSAGQEYNPWLTPDGLTVYFSSNRDDENDHAIFKASRESLAEPFGSAEIVFDGLGSRTLAPYMSPDGQMLYFYDELPDGSKKGTFEIEWVPVSSYEWSEPEFLPELNGKAWGEPEYLPELDGDPNNKAGCPFVSKDALTAYYHRYVPSLNHKCIFTASRTHILEPFDNERMVSELIQTGGNLGSPWLSADGQRLYYHEHHPTTSESFLKVANWSESTGQWIYERTLDEIHYGEGYYEALVSLTDDELLIFWQTNRPDDTGGIDIWTASRPSIDQPFGTIRELTEINTVNHDGGPCISPDGLTLYFNSSYRAGGDETSTGIYKASRSSLSDLFGNVELVAFPGYENYWEHHVHVDFEREVLYFQNTDAGGIWMTAFEPDSSQPASFPHLTPDELTIYYNRYVSELGHKCIFQATRDDKANAFGNERRLDGLIQTGGNLSCSWLSSDGQRLYYNEHTPGTDPVEALLKIAVWSEGLQQWVYERTLNELHYGPGYAEGGVSLSADELTIFWHATRPEGPGSYDIYTANRSTVSEPFGNIRGLTEINTADYEVGPCISEDGLTLYFSSARRAGGDENTSSLYKAIRPSLSEPFGEVELLEIPYHDISWDAFPYVTRDNQSVYYKTMLNGNDGCFVSELVPIQENCLPR